MPNSPGAPAPRPPPFQPRSLGPYRIEAVISSGGMGVVYRAVAPDGRPVALKVLRTALATPDLVRRFQREAQIRVDHPNVIGVLDAGADEDGTPWLALELLEGENLAAMLSRGSLPPADIVRLGSELLAGLAAAHRAGFIHRDLKPGNVFRTKDGVAKVLDFGVALRHDETRITADGAMVGTPSYLAPEQARGEETIDERADLWAVGVLLYEALSAVSPFKRDSLLATVLAVLLEEPLPLSVAFPAAPPGLAAVIEHALAKEPAERWRSADEMRVALLAADLSPSAVPPARARRGQARAPEPAALATGEQRVVAIVVAEGVSRMSDVAEAVRARGGLVLPLLGRRAIGLFGGHAWEGDEVGRAAAAALACRRAATRMSVASGRGTLSGRGVSGDVLRAAEAGCAAGLPEVAVDAEAARALATTWVLRPVSERIFALVAPREGDETEPPPGLSGTAAGFPDAPTLGREVELAQLRKAVRSLHEGRSHLAVLVQGPAGIGKSRLRRELLSMLEEPSPEVFALLGKAEPIRRENSLSLFRSALLSRVRLGAQGRGWPSLEIETTSEARRHAVLCLAREAFPDERAARECADFLGTLLGVDMFDTTALRAARRDPQLMADRLRLALLDYLEALCAQRPVVLVVEDLQWADPASLELLEEAGEQLADAPLLVVATARPEFAEAHPDLLDAGELVLVRPRGLSPSDVARLAAAFLGYELPPDQARAVADRTGGNPLFVEQVVLELRDRGVTGPFPAELPLPLTMEAAVQSRLDHLPPAEKELCKRASVLGRPFRARDLGQLGVLQAEPLLQSLFRRELVVPRGRGTTSVSREYLFRSPLVAEVAYRMIADDVRAELHRRAAICLSARLDVDPEEIALHHERGAEPAKAAQRHVQAALGAAARGDTSTVLRCSERALALGVPPDARFELHVARADALRFLGNRTAQEHELSEALAAARTPARRGRVLTERAVWLARTGRAAEALEAAADAVREARDGDDREVLAVARGWQASGYLYAGDLSSARDALLEAAALAEDASAPVRALAAEWRAQLASAEGDLGARIAAFREAVARYREAGDLRRAAGAEANLADCYNRLGAFAEAEPALQAAIDGCRRVGNRLMEGYALVNLGCALSMQGLAPDALAAIDDAAAIAAETNEARLAVVARVYRCRALLGPFEPGAPAGLVAGERGAAVGAGAPAAPDLPAVAAAMGRAAVEAERAGLPGLQVSALAGAARALLAAGEAAGALALSRAAMELRDRLGGVEEDEGELFLVHAQALEACGDPAGAARIRALGRERVLGIAAGIADLEWRERFLRDVAAHRALVR